MGQIIALPVRCTQLRKRQRQEVDHLSLKDGFCGVYIYKKKGLGLRAAPARLGKCLIQAHDRDFP